jgi:hypothetical protein
MYHEKSDKGRVLLRLRVEMERVFFTILGIISKEIEY